MDIARLEKALSYILSERCGAAVQVTAEEKKHEKKKDQLEKRRDSNNRNHRSSNACN